MKGWILEKVLKALNFFLLGLLILLGIHLFKGSKDSGLIENDFKQSSLESKKISNEIKDSKPFAFKGALFQENVTIENIEIPIQFHGTASAGGRFFAVLKYQGKQILVEKGQKIGVWKVIEISEMDIHLEDENGRQSKLSSKSAVEPEVKELPDRKEKKVENQNYLQVSPQSMKNMITHWADLFRDVSMYPYLEKGKAIGYVLLNVRPDSLVERMGFRTGDIVEKINGKDVTNLETLLSLKSHLEGGDLVIDVKRGPKMIQLVYQMSKDQESKSI